MPLFEKDMYRYVIELRSRQAPRDFSLQVLRLGKRIRIQLRLLALPEPLLYADPQTDEIVAQFYVSLDNAHATNELALTCQNFTSGTKQPLRYSVNLAQA